jgi:putative transcriptional regulator
VPGELQNNLKKYRTAADLTQAALADQFRLSRKTINTIENGMFVPATVLALRLAQHLKVSVHDLFELRL